MTEKFVGPNHEDLVSPLNSLGMIDAYKARVQMSHDEFARAEGIARMPDNGTLLNQVLLNEADLELAAGTPAHAAVFLQESHDLLSKAYPQNANNQWRYALWDSVKAELLAATGDFDAALRLLTEAEPVIRQRFGPSGFYTSLTVRRRQFIEARTHT